MPGTSSSQSQFGFSASPRARNIYSWLRWICCKFLPFTFVEDPLTRALTNLDPICRNTFMDYMEKVTIKIEKKIADDLLEKFGIIFDGWSDMGTSTHYVGIFACYSKMGEHKRLLLAFLALIDEENYTAQSHVNFIESAIKIFNKTMKNTTFVVCGNENTNRLIADDVSEVTKDDLLFAESVLAKRGKMNSLPQLDWVPVTSNIVERLFSRAKYFLSQYRKKLLPRHLENQIFLMCNEVFLGRAFSFWVNIIFETIFVFF